MADLNLTLENMWTGFQPVVANFRVAGKDIDDWLMIVLEIAAETLVDDSTYGKGGELYEDSDHFLSTEDGHLRSTIHQSAVRRAKAAGTLSISVLPGRNYGRYLHEGYTSDIRVKKAKALMVRVGREKAKSIIALKPHATKAEEAWAEKGVIWRKQVGGHTARPFFTEAIKVQRGRIQADFDAVSHEILLTLLNVVG